MEGARDTLANSYISETLPIPNRLKRGDIVKYKGVGDRPGPWKDGIQYPSSAVEIIEVIKPSLGPPQYLVANLSAPGDVSGPGGPPILVNEEQLEAAPLGRNTLGFLEQWDKLDRDIMKSKYNPDFQKGALLPGARTIRDAEALVADNPDMEVGPAWEMMYNKKYNTIGKQQKQVVDASKQLKRTIKKGKKAIDNYKSNSYMRTAEKKLGSYIGDKAASTLVKGNLGVASYLAPHVMIPLAAADSYLSRKEKDKFMEAERNKIASANSKKKLQQANMRKMYDTIHSVQRGKTSVYPFRKFEKDVGKPRLQSKHTRKLMRQDKKRIEAEKKKREEEEAQREKRRNQELRRMAEEMDAEDEAEDEAEAEVAEVKPAHILVNDDVPEEDLLKQLDTIITNYDDVDEDDEDDIIIDGKAPAEPLRRQLQTKINDHNKKKIVASIFSNAYTGETVNRDQNKKTLIADAFAKSSGSGSGRRRTRRHRTKRHRTRRRRTRRPIHSRKKRRKASKATRR